MKTGFHLFLLAAIVPLSANGLDLPTSVIAKSEGLSDPEDRSLGFLRDGRCQRRLQRCQAQNQEGGLATEAWLSDLDALAEESQNEIIGMIRDFVVQVGDFDSAAVVETYTQDTSGLYAKEARSLVQQVRGIDMPQDASLEELQAATESMSAIARDDSNALFFDLYGRILAFCLDIWVRLFEIFLPVIFQGIWAVITFWPRLWWETIKVLLGINRFGASDIDCSAQLLQCSYEKSVRPLVTGMIEIATILAANSESSGTTDEETTP